jgi:two-component system chemotaxis sensor kinase CheA
MPPASEAGNAWEEPQSASHPEVDEPQPSGAVGAGGVTNPSLAQLAEHVAGTGSGPGEADPADAEPADAAGFSLADDPELLADFIQEAVEHLASIEALTLVIERTPDDRESLNALFRSFHSIKGLAGFLELHAIRELSHQVETLLDRARNGESRIGGPAIDAILAGADFIQRGVEVLKLRLQGNRKPLPPLDHELCETVARLSQQSMEPVAEGEQQLPAVSPTPAAESAPAMPAVQAAKTVPTPVPGKAATDRPQRGEPAAAPANQTAGGATANTGSVKVETAKLDYLVDMVGEFVIAQSIVRHDPDLQLAEHPRLQRNFAQMARITAEIQRTAMSMRMVPIQGLFQRMARLVRDLARKTSKDVEFVSVGEETELDRTLIEQLADPLMHMVRNSLDHGLEPADERERAGKNPRGRVQLRAAHESGGILIEISDDGRGLSREKILGRAIERGLLPPNANPPDSEVWGLIFEPGFSTAEKVTDISGRGVGMDVVRRNIQQLRGRIEVTSEMGKGTSVLLRLPLTLAIIDALMVGIGSDRFILPMYAVREMFRPAKGVVTKVCVGGGSGSSDEVVDVRGSLLAVHRLDALLGVKSRSQSAEQGLLVVLENQSGHFCLLVDEFLGKQEVVIKPLGAMFRHVSGISAGAILGDGKVALILDIDGLLQRKAGPSGSRSADVALPLQELAHA